MERIIPEDAEFYQKSYRGGSIGVYYRSESEDGREGAHYVGFTSYPAEDGEPATPEQIEKFKEEWTEYWQRVEAEEKRCDEILATIGLTTNDFCRFRSAYREGSRIIVRTRENGAGGFSTEAVRKAGDRLISREVDEFDSTYVYYTFKL